MALSILDGNQTATTLSTILTGGAHIPAHTVVSFGSQAITDISGAVSGSVVSISNFPSSQTIQGTVTANTGLLQPLTDAQLRASSVTIGIASLPASTVTVSSLPAISGTVTANLPKEPIYGGIDGLPVWAVGDYQPDTNGVKAIVLDVNGNNAFQGTGINVTSLPAISGTVTIGSLPAISGAVTASVINSVTVGSLPVQLSTTTIGGTARLNVTLSSATTVGGTAPSYANLYGGSDGTNLRAILTDTAGRSVVTISNFPSSQTISGTVTATIASTTVTVSALPSGALTTRFGSVTTANTAQLTAAVTNSARRYLLAQNISAATVTIGIGFSPTTTQGIQLTSGAGLTFDAFCLTGAVYWLGAVTGAAFTILEG